MPVKGVAMEEGEAEEEDGPEPPEPGGVAELEPEAKAAGELRLARLLEAVEAAGADAALVAAAGAGGAAVVLAVAAGGVEAGGTTDEAGVAASAATVDAGVEAGVAAVELTGTAVTGITEREASEPAA